MRICLNNFKIRGFKSEIPPATQTTGVDTDIVTQSEDHSIKQPELADISTKIAKPIIIKSKPPTRKSYKRGE